MPVHEPLESTILQTLENPLFHSFTQRNKGAFTVTNEYCGFYNYKGAAIQCSLRWQKKCIKRSQSKGLAILQKEGGHKQTSL